MKPLRRRPLKKSERIVDRWIPGTVLRDRYRIVRLVGRGGMGEVYEAEDLESGERVAVKSVLARHLGSAKVLARFRREIDLSQRISHPNVLRINDVFELPPEKEGPFAGKGSVPCMVMEFLTGETLADRLADGRRVSPEEGVSLVAQMARALAAAHAADVVHRDLKPDNIFLVPQGDSTRVVLTDFGVARPNRSEEEESFTATDVIVGTPTYMAPEQLELEEAIPASDIYTLGLVVYEMLTGEFPFQGDTAIQVVFMRVQQEPISPREHMPELSEWWERLILKCLSRDPADRPASAMEIVRYLENRSNERSGSKKSAWWPF